MIKQFHQLIVREKIRTKKKAIKEMLVKMQALCKDGADYSDKVYISVCTDVGEPRVERPMIFYSALINLNRL